MFIKICLHSPHSYASYSILDTLLVMRGAMHIDKQMLCSTLLLLIRVTQLSADSQPRRSKETPLVVIYTHTG